MVCEGCCQPLQKIPAALDTWPTRFVSSVGHKFHAFLNIALPEVCPRLHKSIRIRWPQLRNSLTSHVRRSQLTARSFLLFDADEVRLRDLVGRPANSRAGRSGDDSGVHAAEEALRALSPVDDACGVEEAAGIADLHVGAGSSRLEQGLDDVQRCGCGCGDTAGETTGGAVGERVVAGFSAALHGLCEGLVCGELQGREGDGHGEGGGVGGVEGTDAFGSVDGARALADVAEGGTVDLHALLDHVEGVHESVAGDGSACSAGCCTRLSVLSAQWGMLACLPAAIGWWPAALPPMACFTTSYVAKYTACAGPYNVSEIVQTLVISAYLTCAEHDTGDTPPQ